MINPFKRLSEQEKTQNRLKKQLQNEISAQAWTLSKQAMKGKIAQRDYSKLEILYERYFREFPDKAGEQRAQDRLSKLRKIM